MLRDCDYKMSSNNNTLQSQGCYYGVIFHFAKKKIVNGKWIFNRCKQSFRFASFDLVLIIIKTDLEIVIESEFSKRTHQLSSKTTFDLLKISTIPVRIDSH